MADIGVRIAIDGEQNFKTALSAINASLASMDEECKAAAEGIAAMTDKEQAAAARQELIAKSTELYRQKLEVLNKQHDTANDKLQALGAALEKAEQEFGKNSKEAGRAADAYNRQQATVANLERQINKTNREMNDTPQRIERMTTATEEAAPATEKWQKSIESMGKIMKLNFAGSVIKTAVAGIKSVTDALSGAVKGAFSLSQAAGQMADDLVTTSQQTGIATKNLQEWEYASRFIDTSVDTITGSMTKLTTNMASTSESTQEAFKKLGVRVKDSAGHMRDSEAVFFDAIDALGKVRNETERDQLAMTLFGKSAKELNPLILAGSKAFKEMAGEARAMGTVFSDEALAQMGGFDDAMQRLDAASVGLKNTIGQQLIPVFQPLVDAASRSMGELSALLKDGLQTGDMSQFIKTFKQQFSEGFASVGETVKKALPAILDAVREIFYNMELFFKNEFPGFANEIGGFFTELGAIVAPYLQPVGEKIMSALGAALSATIGAIDWGGIALSLLQGLWNGLVSAMQWLLGKLGELWQMIVDSVKDFFGIHSPSTLMADIGGFLLSGFAEGILSGLSHVLDVVGQVFGKIWDSIKSFFGFGKGKGENEDAKETGAAIMESMESGIEGSKEKMENAAKTAATDALTAIRGVYGIPAGGGDSPVMNQLGQTLDNGVAGGVGDALAALLDVGRAAMESLRAAFTDAIGGEAATKFVTIGLQIDRGIAKGITDNVSIITQAAEEAAKAAYDAACAALDIHSPSALFRKQVGRMIPAGMALGITDGLGDITDAVGLAGAAATAGLGGLAAGGAHVGGGLNITQNVYANATSYAAQQKECANQMGEMARRLRYV